MTMADIDALIKAASTCSPKLTESKEFKQVWFTRPELERLVQLIATECMMQCNEVRDNAAVVDPADPTRTRDGDAIDHICMGANSSKFKIAKAFGIDVMKVW